MTNAQKRAAPAVAANRAPAPPAPWDATPLPVRPQYGPQCDGVQDTVRTVATHVPSVAPRAAWRSPGTARVMDAGDGQATHTATAPDNGAGARSRPEARDSSAGAAGAAKAANHAKAANSAKAANHAKAANSAKAAKPSGLAALGDGGSLRQSWRPAGARLLRLDAVAPRAVRWLWPGRIPLGKLTILDGDPGQGKSLLTLDLAARVSQGTALPDGARGDLDGPAGVVLLSAEDDPADTILPRLLAAGGDPSRVVLLQGVREVRGEEAAGEGAERERGVTLLDLEAIRAAVMAVDARLVVIDPLMAYLGSTDAHVDAAVRAVLAPLSRLSAELDVAVVVVRHLTKAGGGQPLYRGGGSIGFVAAARAGLLVAPDPDDASGRRRVLAVTKSNLAAHPPSLAYAIEAPDGVPRVVWLGTCAHDARALLTAPAEAEERGALADAEAFLRDLLASGPVDTDRVKAEARKAGVAERTLWRAKTLLGVRAQKSGFGDTGRWRWALPRPADDATGADSPAHPGQRRGGCVLPASSLRLPNLPKAANATGMAALGDGGSLRGDTPGALPRSHLVDEAERLGLERLHGPPGGRTEQSGALPRPAGQRGTAGLSGPGGPAPRRSTPAEPPTGPGCTPQAQRAGPGPGSAGIDSTRVPLPGPVRRGALAAIVLDTARRWEWPRRTVAGRYQDSGAGRRPKAGVRVGAGRSRRHAPSQAGQARTTAASCRAWRISS